LSVKLEEFLKSVNLTKSSIYNYRYLIKSFADYKEIDMDDILTYEDYEIEDMLEEAKECFSERTIPIMYAAINRFRDHFIDRSIMGITDNCLYTDTRGGIRLKRTETDDFQVKNLLLAETLIVLDYFNKNQPYAGYINRWSVSSLAYFIRRHIFYENGDSTISWYKAREIAKFILNVAFKYSEVFRLSTQLKPNLKVE